MNRKDPEAITFRVVVVQLNLSSRLLKRDFGDIRVTIRVGDVSKITCSGKLSKNHQRVIWDHPFIFTVPPSTSIRVAICTLPKELTPEWDKQPLGDQMITNVASLLQSKNWWQCNVPGLSFGPGTLSMTCRVCDFLVAPDGHDCASDLQKYDMKLYKFGLEWGNVPSVSTKIELGLAKLDLCPPGHADHTGILNDLAVSFHSRYNQEGNISDLNRAIEIAQTRLDLCPLDHPEHAGALRGLVFSLWSYYRIQDNKAYLNRLTEMAKRWFELCPPGHSDHATALGMLGLSLWECYVLQGNITDLNMSIELGEKRLALCPAGYPDHSLALANLAVALHDRYIREGNLNDLHRAIDLKEKSLELYPTGHQDRQVALRNLAMSLKYFFYVGKNYSHLIRAITLLEEALNICPTQHSHYALTIAELAGAILLSANFSKGCHPPDQPFPLPDEAFRTYGLLKTCGPAVSLCSLEATQHWVQDAEEHNHTSVLEAYQTALNTLDHFTSLNPSLDSRHEAMQARVASLANNAFSCAARHGDFQMAIELLEQGRGILWNQLARFDISIVALENRGNQERELGRKFTQLSADIRKHAEGSGGESMEPYWRVQEAWEAVVDKIRRLDGFSQFLLPPHFDDLQRVAECGPIVIVNASEYTCDALIVLHDRQPVHVSLPCDPADVSQLCSYLSELTKDPHAYGDNREPWVKQMLRDLWSLLVEPIVTVLQYDIQLPLGSRIWWYPTAKSTILPLHAAGPYRKGAKNLMDIYVSSYAPSLSALIRTRDRVRSQREVRNASGLANGISFAAVGQARPSAATKLSELPEVELEIDKIRNETGIPPGVKFETVTGAAATIEGAVQAFRDHRWIHLACHGAQHAEKPFESWFAMGDGMLTLMRIIQERYTNSEFAFLSACHTAVGDSSTPDEVLHLAAGMQFAGFNGVIGTLWRVDDAVAHQVVTRFYKEMFKGPVIDFERAAAALNVAVVESAQEVSLEKRIVFVHIGI